MLELVSDSRCQFSCLLVDLLRLSTVPIQNNSHHRLNFSFDILAFKLVWCPTESFDIFVLVDDEGKELAHGKPTGRLPSLQERQVNYKVVAGSKYAVAAEKIARGETSSTA